VTRLGGDRGDLGPAGAVERLAGRGGGSGVVDLLLTAGSGGDFDALVTSSAAIAAVAALAFRARLVWI
jgi:uncharacterized membrane protein YebE (DUF533 family)